MLTLNENFKAAVRAVPNTPSFIVKLVESEIYTELDSQTDFLGYVSASNIDTTTESGSVMLPKVAPAKVQQLTIGSTVQMGAVVRTVSAGTTTSPTTPGTTSFAWQSFKTGLSTGAYLKKFCNRVLAQGSLSGPGGWNNTIYYQLYDSKNGTPLSSIRTIGGANYTADAMVGPDFSSERIPLAAGTTYWMKVWGFSSGTLSTSGKYYSVIAGIDFRYKNTSVYSDGQLDAKAWNASEGINIGDLAFTVSFLDSYQSVGYCGYMMDVGSTPTVPGEFRVDSLTPLDSTITHRLFTLTDPTTLDEVMSSDSTVATAIAFNGNRLVRILTASPWAQYSDNGGVSWTGCTSLSAALGTIVWTGQAFIAAYDAASPNVARSADGVSWANVSVTTSDRYRVYFAGAYVFAIRWVTSTATQKQSSPDGLTWSNVTFANAKYWGAVAYGNGTYIAAPGESGAHSTCGKSSNGTAWTLQTLPATLTYADLCFGAGLFILTVTNASIAYYTSPTGATGDWTERVYGGGGDSFSSAHLAYSGEIGFIVYTSVSGSSSKTVGFSVDGISWTLSSTLAPSAPRGLISYLDGFYGCNGAVSTYQKEYHHPDFTEVGSYVESQEISALSRYYFVMNYLTPDTTGSTTPLLRSLRLYFPTWITLSTTPDKGYEPSVASVSSLQTSIDTFKPSTVGQVSLGLALTEKVGAWLSGSHPRNKEVRIYAGFVSIAESDFISYYRGNVEEWTLDQHVSVTLRDFTKTWAGSPCPLTWKSTADDKVWTDIHPVDVMLDLLQGYVGTGTKAVSGGSFNAVKAVLDGWVVSNTITGKTQDSKALLEQLRFVTGTYFVPQPDGRTKLKLWDPTEAPVLQLTDDDMIGVQYRGNSGSLVNLLNWYFNLNPDDTAKSGGISLHQEQDSMSQFNNGEKKTFEFKDYWTLTANEVEQVWPVSGAVVTRFAAIPDILTLQLDLRFIELEASDIVGITTKMVPTADLLGVSQVPYQITRRDLDFVNSRIRLEVLRVA